MHQDMMSDIYWSKKEAERAHQKWKERDLEEKWTRRPMCQKPFKTPYPRPVLKG